jgi:hypothetical protein
MTSADVLKYLKSNLNNNTLRVEPFFGDGLQDPLTWMTNFAKACKVNDWDDNKAVVIFNALFQDEAEEW